MAREKLTRAQRTFMTQLSKGALFDTHVLTGSEVAMAWRLGDRGLVQYVQRDSVHRFGSPTAWKFVLTDAGRQALAEADHG